MTAALCLAYGLRYHFHFTSRAPGQPPIGIYAPPLAIAGLSWYALYALLGLDGFRGGWRFIAIASRLATAVPISLALADSALYFEREYVSRLILGLFGLLYFGGLLLLRCAVAWRLEAEHRRGGAERVLLVGEERMTAELEGKIGDHPELMLRVIGRLRPGAESGERGEMGSLDVLDLIERERVSQLIVAMSQYPGPEFHDLLAHCRQRGVRISVLPQPYELYTSRPRLVELDNLPLLALDDPPAPGWASGSKRVFDLALLVLLAPLALAILAPTVVALRLSGKRRPLRREQRCGKNGLVFDMWKLDVSRYREEQSHLEYWLHRFSIVELPQLWNVLRGEMSLVGPRPETPGRVRNYTDWQRQRLLQVPGLTGLAQVHDLRDEHPAEVKTHFDLQYSLTWSPLLDLSLLLQTVLILAYRLGRPRPVFPDAERANAHRS